MFVTALDEIAPAIRMDAVDVILSDHHYWGGLTGDLRLDTIARTFDPGLACTRTHTWVSIAAMAHVGAAMPTARYAADTHYPWMADDVVSEPLAFDDGHIEPQGPGLGVELDEAAVDHMPDRWRESDTLGYSSVESMAAEYADAMAETDDSWLPNKPRR